MCSSARPGCSQPLRAINEIAGLVPVFGQKNPNKINGLKIA
jgi:hypothetical protein